MKADVVGKIPSRGFEHDRVVGAAAKEILWSLLEYCGYTVYPFGYESTFATVKRHLREKRFERNDLAQRIRSMPDFLVAGDEEPPQLVEVQVQKDMGCSDSPSDRFRELGNRALQTVLARVSSCSPQPVR